MQLEPAQPRALGPRCQRESHSDLENSPPYLQVAPRHPQADFVPKEFAQQTFGD
jgi:hypothetical protein